MTKEQEILEFSNPTTVINRAHKYYGKDTQIKVSTRKDKKYMILDPNTNKWVHFGQMSYEDFTKHKDPVRREKFKNRNSDWADRYKYNPGYLSYHLLW